MESDVFEIDEPKSESPSVTSNQAQSRVDDYRVLCVSKNYFFMPLQVDSKGIRSSPAGRRRQGGSRIHRRWNRGGRPSSKGMPVRR